MDIYKIISLTHSEDLDGLCSQTIIYRYFSILKKPIPQFLLGNDTNNKPIHLVTLRTDYTDFPYYLSAIFAQNLHKFNQVVLDKLDLSKNSINHKFHEIWKRIYNFMMVEDNFQPFEELYIETKINIEKYHKEFSDIDMILISDLGFNQSFKPFFPIFDAFNCKISYLDHHEHDPETRAFFARRCQLYNISEDKCATQIVQGIFLPNDEIAKNITFFGIDSDFQKWQNPLSEQFQSTISKYSYNYEILDLFRDLFAIGDFKNPKLTKLYQDLKVWEKDQENYLFNHMIKKNIPLGNYPQVEIILSASEMRPGRTLRTIERNYEKLFGHKFDSNDKNTPHIMISLNIVNGKMNIKSNVFNVFKVANYFKGGGHIERAGFNVPQEFLKNNSLTGNYLEKLDIDGFLKKVLNVLQSFG